MASTTIQSPARQTHQTGPNGSLLLMPSWSLSPSSFPYLGVKFVTHFPLNSPGVHTSYVLFSSLTGQTLASIDGTELTLIRTSCVSGLASLYLSNLNSKVLVMIGAGALAPHLIRAHLSSRPSLNRVIIWNRTAEKARELVRAMIEEGSEFDGVSFENGESLEEAVRIGDVISCATNSETPMVAGAAMKCGAHLDLVGSFKAWMRECDDEAIWRGRVFVDNDAALEEAGELVGAFERGVVYREDIAGELVKGEKVGRRDEREITVFKSVGSAVVDLLSAQLAFETFVSSQVRE